MLVVIVGVYGVSVRGDVIGVVGFDQVCLVGGFQYVLVVGQVGYEDIGLVGFDFLFVGMWCVEYFECGEFEFFLYYWFVQCVFGDGDYVVWFVDVVLGFDVLVVLGGDGVNVVGQVWLGEMQFFLVQWCDVDGEYGDVVMVVGNIGDQLGEGVVDEFDLGVEVVVECFGYVDVDVGKLLCFWVVIVDVEIVWLDVDVYCFVGGDVVDGVFLGKSWCVFKKQ